MIRKTSLMAATIIAVWFVAADSVWACKFLDNVCCRCRRSCAWTYQCTAPSACCLPKACGPVGTGTIDFKGGTLTVAPSEEPAETATPTPAVDKSPEPSMQILPETTAPVERAIEPKATTPVAEPPKEPEATPAVPMTPEEPKVEPPKEPEAKPAEPMIAEEPKAEPPKEPEAKPAEPMIPEEPKAEPPKEKVAEPETDAFGNVTTEPSKKADEEPAAEPKAAEPVAEPPKPSAPEKKEDEKDPFGKNNVKEYRMWTDASGEFQVEAKFVGIVDGQVRLQKTNGRYVRIEMNMLCMDDQHLIRQFASLAGNW